MTLTGAGAVLTEPDQTVLSVSGGMVERTLRQQAGLDQVRDGRCQPVVVCLLSAGPQSPPARPPARLRALGSPGQSSVDALGQQTTVEIVEQLGPGGRVVAPADGVLVTVGRGLHLLGVDQERRGLRGEVRGGGRGHSLPPPGWQGPGTPDTARPGSCSPPAASHRQLLNHWKVCLARPG